MTIAGYIAFGLGASVALLNVYLSWIRGPLLRWLWPDRNHSWVSGLPLLGFALLIAATLLPILRPLRVAALVLAVLDTGGPHWLAAVMVHQWWTERGEDCDDSLDPNRPYSRRELRRAGHGFPERGALCRTCKTHVPQFVELSDDDRRRILDLIDEDPLGAMSELEAVTGCPPRWAKIWVQHRGDARFKGPPCPECGEPLPSAGSRQCLHCKADWH